MIRDALGAGADVYDLRGITDTLDADDSHVGLIQFKVGTGGEAVEYAGEWDLPLNRPLYKAFDLYMSAARAEPCSPSTSTASAGGRTCATVAERHPGPRAGRQGQRLRLRQRAGWRARLAPGLGVDTLAVGTYAEVAEVAEALRRRPAGADPVAALRDPAPTRDAAA